MFFIIENEELCLQKAIGHLRFYCFNLSPIITFTVIYATVLDE